MVECHNDHNNAAQKINGFNSMGLNHMIA
jgi:hypothetical protein